MIKPPSLSIHQPQPFETMTACEYTDAGGVVHYIIVASGKARRIKKDAGSLVASLVGHAGNAPIRGVVLKASYHWSIVFSIPMPAAAPGTKYHLFVGRTDRDSAKGQGNPGVSVEFFVIPPPRGGVGDGRGVIPVSYPQPNAAICTPFTAYGANGPTGPASAGQMQGGNSFAGSALAAPNGSWAIQFGNLPDDDYTLRVSNAADSGSVINITVDSESCNGTVAPEPPTPAS